MKRFLSVLFALLILCTTVTAESLDDFKAQFDALNEEFASKYQTMNDYEMSSKLAFENYIKESSKLVKLTGKGNLTEEGKLDCIYASWMMCVEMTNCINASVDESNSYMSDFLGMENMNDISEMYRYNATLKSTLCFINLFNQIEKMTDDMRISADESNGIMKLIDTCNEEIISVYDPANKDELTKKVENVQQGIRK